MAKTVTETKTKTATKDANTKTARRPKKDATNKPKREPTAYEIFRKEHMKKWNEENPGRAKEAMGHVAGLWKTSPENPNLGKEPKARKPREKKAKEAAEPKEKKPRVAKKTAAKEAEKEEESAGSDE